MYDKAPYDKKRYFDTSAWEHNEYLVNPLRAVKKCCCCKRNWYTIEFADCDEFTDGKYPVCNRCSRKKKNRNKITSLVAPMGVRFLCKKCNTSQSAEQFIARSSDWVTITTTCNNCRTMPKEAVPN